MMKGRGIIAHPFEISTKSHFPRTPRRANPLTLDECNPAQMGLDLKPKLADHALYDGMANSALGSGSGGATGAR